MGNSLHNKIYLGRRTARLNTRRTRFAAWAGASAGVAAIMWLMAN